MMQQLKQYAVIRSLAEIYFEIKRQYYRIRYPNVRLEKGVQIVGALRIGGSVRLTIGAGSRIGKNVLIQGNGEITLGKNVSLNGPWIYSDASISIGDDCLISDCFIVDSDFHNLEPHLRHCPPSSEVKAPIQIDRNVWVGARATIMKGVHIGENSVVGLGSVVRQSIPAGVVVIGNPQQIVKAFNARDRSAADLPVISLKRC